MYIKARRARRTMALGDNFLTTAWNYWAHGIDPSAPSVDQIKYQQELAIRARGIDPATGKLIGPQYAPAFLKSTGINPNDKSATLDWIAKNNAAVAAQLQSDYSKLDAMRKDEEGTSSSLKNYFLWGAIILGGAMAVPHIIGAVAGRR